MSTSPSPSHRGPNTIRSSPLGPASNARVTSGATRIASRVSSSAGASEDDVDLLSALMLVGERLALLRLETVVAESGVFGVERILCKSSFLDVAEARLRRGILDVGELPQGIGGGHGCLLW